MNETKIALTGKMRSGKSTVAEYLAKEYGFKRVSFSTELKRCVYYLFDIKTFDNRYGKPREILQKFGQFCRTIDNDVWVRKCFQEIKCLENLAKLLRRKDFRIVIDDLRQPNEYDRCRAEGFVIVRVTAPDSLRIERIEASGEGFDLEAFNHETEQYVDTFDVDYEIRNDSDLDSLYAQVDAIMRNLGVTKKTNKG